MKRLGTVPLTTPRLLLRPFTAADAPAMYQNWASDPEVTKFLRWPPYPDVGLAGNLSLSALTAGVKNSLLLRA